MRVFFVSVNQTYRPGMSIKDIEPCVERAWAIGRPKVDECELVVAIWSGVPIAAWKLRGTFSDDETWNPGGARTPRRKTGLILGDAMPLDPMYAHHPSLRHGCATQEISEGATVGAI